MTRLMAALALSVILAAVPSGLVAQDGGAKSAKAPAPQVGKGEKLCQYTFPTGEKRSWVCKKEQPCCAWDLISYVKCGSTITGCL
jgi:hypothetical protein